MPRCPRTWLLRKKQTGWALSPQLRLHPHRSSPGHRWKPARAARCMVPRDGGSGRGSLSCRGTRPPGRLDQGHQNGQPWPQIPAVVNGSHIVTGHQESRVILGLCPPSPTGFMCFLGRNRASTFQESLTSSSPPLSGAVLTLCRLHAIMPGHGTISEDASRSGICHLPLGAKTRPSPLEGDGWKLCLLLSLCALPFFLKSSPTTQAWGF